MPARGRPFAPGKSANPAGRPRGIRPKHLQILDAILADEGGAILQQAVDMAKEGDVGAMRLCLDRVMPARKDRPINFDLPSLDSPADLPKVTAALLAGVAAGQITPSEAADLGRSIDVHLKAVAAGIFDVRLAALEANSTPSDQGDEDVDAEPAACLRLRE